MTAIGNTDLVVPIFDGDGAPLTGLASGATWTAFVEVIAGTDASASAPTITETAVPGTYAIPLLQVSGKRYVGTVDFGATANPRYVSYDSPYVISAGLVTGTETPGSLSLPSSSASSIAICNMALAHIGVRKTITSMDPSTDASSEAAACALFWDVERKKLLSGFPWKFATRFAALQEFAVAFSAVEHIGSGESILVTGMLDFANVSKTFVGTYNILVQVYAADPVQFKLSFDGGVTWSYVIADPVVTEVDFPDAAGDATLYLSFSSGVDLVVGDVYRFTVTDGLCVEYTYAYSLPSDLLVGKYLWPGTRMARADQRVPWKRGYFGSLTALWSDYGPDSDPTINYVEDVTDASRFTPGFASALSWKLADVIAKPLKVKPETDAKSEFQIAINEARANDFVESQIDVPPESETIAARGYFYSSALSGMPPPSGGWWPY